MCRDSSAFEKPAVLRWAAQSCRSWDDQVETLVSYPIFALEAILRGGQDSVEVRGNPYALRTTLLLHCRYFQPFLLLRWPWLRKYIFDHRGDRMRGYAYRSRKVRGCRILRSSHRNRVCCVPYMRDMGCRRLDGHDSSKWGYAAHREGRTGNERYKRGAAMRSQGGSKVTTEAPNVIPRSK
jgi:hypothetical protein